MDKYPILTTFGILILVGGIITFFLNWNKIFPPSVPAIDESGGKNELQCEITDAYGNKKTISSKENTEEFKRMCEQNKSQNMSQPVYPYTYNTPYYINRWYYNGYYYPNTWAGWRTIYYV